MNLLQAGLIRLLGGTVGEQSVNAVAVPTRGLTETRERMASCIKALRLIDGLLAGGQVVAAHKQVRILYTSLSGEIAPPRIPGAKP